jgi:hypothetical protein
VGPIAGLDAEVRGKVLCLCQGSFNYGQYYERVLLNDVNISEFLVIFN